MAPPVLKFAFCFGEKGAWGYLGERHQAPVCMKSARPPRSGHDACVALTSSERSDDLTPSHSFIHSFNTHSSVVRLRQASSHGGSEADRRTPGDRAAGPACEAWRLPPGATLEPGLAGPRGAGKRGHGHPRQGFLHVKPRGPLGKAEQVRVTGARDACGTGSQWGALQARGTAGRDGAGPSCPASRGNLLKPLAPEARCQEPCGGAVTLG